MSGALRVFFLSLTSALALCACLPSGSGAAKVELDSARARWKEKGPPAYQLTLQWSCFCGPDYTRPVRIAVRDGAIASAVDVDSGAAVDPVQRNSKTVDQLFDVIDDAIHRNAAQLAFSYDSQDGHPVSASIDYVAEAADDELAFTVRDLQPAP